MLFSRAEKKKKKKNMLCQVADNFSQIMITITSSKSWNAFKCKASGAKANTSDLPLRPLLSGEKQETFKTLSADI